MSIAQLNVHFDSMQIEQMNLKLLQGILLLLIVKVLSSPAEADLSENILPDPQSNFSSHPCCSTEMEVVDSSAQDSLKLWHLPWCSWAQLGQNEFLWIYFCPEVLPCSINTLVVGDTRCSKPISQCSDILGPGPVFDIYEHRRHSEEKFEGSIGCGL